MLHSSLPSVLPLGIPGPRAFAIFSARNLLSCSPGALGVFLHASS